MLGVLPIHSIPYFLKNANISFTHEPSSISSVSSSIASFADASITTLQLYSLQISLIS